jgi:hypothetical protein
MTGKDNEGIQKRIDKLVAQREAEKKRADDLEAQLRSKDLMGQASRIIESDLPEGWSDMEPDQQSAYISAKVAEAAAKGVEDKAMNAAGQVKAETEVLVKEEIAKIRLENMGFNGDQIEALTTVQKETGVKDLAEAIALAKIRSSELFKGVNPGEVPGSHFVQNGLPPTMEGDTKAAEIKSLQEKAKAVKKGSAEAKAIAIALIKAQM